MMIRLEEKGTTLTWGPGLSTDPGSEAIVAPIVAAVAATGALGGDHPQMVVVAAEPMVVAVAARPMVAAAAGLED